MLVQANLVFVVLAHQAARQIAFALHRQALDQQTSGHVFVCRQHQGGVELLALQHVVFQHRLELVDGLAMVVKQRHYALVGLLARKLGLRVQRNSAAALVVHVDHLAERGAVWHWLQHGGGGAQLQAGLHFHHGELDRAVAHDLQH